MLLKRIRSRVTGSREIDEEKLRDHSIRQLRSAANMAYGIMNDERIDVKSRQGWFKRYTDATRVLTLALKAREEKDWEKRLREVREYRKKTVSPDRMNESQSSDRG